MKIETTYFISTILVAVAGTASFAENKFLAPTADAATDTVSCSAPAGMVAIVSNILPHDAYLARTGPSVDSEYRFSYYGLEMRAFLAQEFMTTTDQSAAQACNQIEQGNVTPDVQQIFNEAVEANLLWWPVQADKGFDDDSQDVVEYISAKHISFVSQAEWAEMSAPNALGYLQLGNRSVPVPISKITGRDTENATAVVTGTIAYASAALSYCIGGFNPSDLHFAFHPPRENQYDAITLPADQTVIAIHDGIWSGCRESELNEYGDYINEAIGMDVGASVEVVANCPAMTIGDFEVTADLLPVSYGAAGGLGTNFATLCPAMTEQILQADCDAGNEFSCGGLAEFLEQ